jgi:hypothetical protein
MIENLDFKFLEQLTDKELLNKISETDPRSFLFDQFRSEILDRLSRRGEYVRFWRNEYNDLDLKHNNQIITNIFLWLAAIVLLLMLFWG